MSKKDKNRTPLSLKITLIVLVSITGLAITVLAILRSVQSNMNFYSRYTYVKEMPLNSTDSMKPEEEAENWIKSFLGQFEGTLVPAQERLNNVNIESVEIADSKKDTVRIRFSAALADAGSDYFAEWDPAFSDGRMKCDWIVKLGVLTTENNKDGIYVISMSDNVKETVAPVTEEPTRGKKDIFTEYKIEGGQLSVSFDGGENFVSVPVDLKNLPLAADDDALVEGSYCLSQESAAFLAGGATVNGEKIPVSAVYTNDSGATWVTSEVDSVFDVSYYYMNMFGEKEGVIVLGYAATATEEFSKIYYTFDGGETWQAKGSGPQTIPLKGVNFIDRDTGFFSYVYDASSPSNLYVTRDGASNFSAVSFPTQQLDSDAGNRKWEEVYKEATVPVMNEEGVLEVFLTQGADGTYHDGKTAAKYISEDKGVNWKYVEQTTFISEGN